MIARRLGLALLALLAAGCSSADYVLHPDLPGGGGVIPGQHAFANEPTGLVPLTHARWRGSAPAGWNLRTAYPGSAIDIVSDPTSPTGGALEMRYPRGLQDGLQPGVVWFSGVPLAGAREMFLGVVMRYSSNWITHNNEVKLHLFATGGSWFGIFDGCWNNRVTQWSVGTRGISGFPVGNGDCWANNVQPSPQYNNGDWVRQELYVRRNDPGLNNGIVRLWIDGRLISEVTTMRFPPSFVFEEFQHAGTWGGGGSPVPQDQSVFIAETYISAR